MFARRSIIIPQLKRHFDAVISKNNFSLYKSLGNYKELSDLPSCGSSVLCTSQGSLPNILKNKRLVQHLHSRSLSTMTENFEEIRIPIPYGHIAAKLWNPNAPSTVLMLHGWQDNAGTFDHLAPLLPSDWRLVALDFQGHGRSSHKPAGTTETMLGYSLTVERVVRHLGCEKVAIIAHSMGAGVAMLYAGAMPHRVTDLVLLDFVSPISVEAADQPRRTAEAFEGILRAEEKLSATARPSYPYEELVRRGGAGRDLSETSVRTLLKRGSREVDDGHSFTYDLMVRVPNVLQLTVEQQLGFVARLKECRVMLLRAKEGERYQEESHYQRFIDAYRATCEEFECHTVPGHHHTHLDTPCSVLTHINTFLKDL